MTSTPDVELPIQEQIAYIANQIVELCGMGVIIHMGVDPLPKGLIGTFSQVLPDGPLMVWVDATTALRFQSYMLVQAFEFLFNEPDTEWEITEHTVDGQVVRRRSISIRVED